MLARSFRFESSLLLLTVAAVACGSPRSGESPATTFADAGTGGSNAHDSSESGDIDVILDVGGLDIPSNECASVEQAATIEDRPSDIILITDPEADQKLVQAAVANLSPQLESLGIFDARVILIAGPPPPITGNDVEYDCGTWTCWSPEEILEGRFFEILEREIDPDTVLTDLLELSEDWQPLLRDDSWKHIWLTASRGADTKTSGEAFAAAFGGLGPSYTNFVFHTGLTEGFIDDDFIELARGTGGAYFPIDEFEGGSSYSDFADAVSEQLRVNPLSCTYDIPAPPEGHTFDRNQVNVDYDDGLSPRTLGYVDSVEACAEFVHGWYYDDPADPQQILVCPETCGHFRVQTLASIQIRFGCTTVPAG